MSGHKRRKERSQLATHSKANDGDAEPRVVLKRRFAIRIISLSIFVGLNQNIFRNDFFLQPNRQRLACLFHYFKNKPMLILLKSFLIYDGFTI
jgi:hypothetical protein